MWWYGIIPVMTMSAGAWLVTFYTFNARLMSAIQHLSAGIIMAVLACEFVPHVLASAAVLAPTIGFLLGMVAMLFLKVLSENCRKQKHINAGVWPLGIMIAVGIDIFLDGMLMGVGFKSSTQAGQLITFSLAIEIGFLGVALMTTCRQYGLEKLTALVTTIAISIAVFIGFLISLWWLQGVGHVGLIAFEAFGIAALLYLAAEELLVEAHDVAEDLPWMTAPFFLGFLMVLLLEKL